MNVADEYPDDYGVCPENEDGKHGPLVSIYDPEQYAGFATIQCERCGLTTGMEITPRPRMELRDS